MIKEKFVRVQRFFYSLTLVAAMGVGMLGGVPANVEKESASVVQAATMDLSDYLVVPKEFENDQDKTEAVDNSAKRISNHPVCENWLTPVEITDGKTASVVRRSSAVYAAKYDSRNVNGVAKVSAVRNQGNHQTCWAFALIAAMESNLIKKGYADTSIDLSENQLAYFFYNRQTDKLGYTAGDYNNCGFNASLHYGKYAWAENGGTLQGAAIALATWAGATTEERSKYISIPDKSLCYQHDYSVENVMFYNYDIANLTNSVNTIKQAVLDYGAVAAGIYSDTDSFYRDNGAYYCNRSDLEGTRHAITIVGWDDTYSLNNFREDVKPSRNGAWIVKNSYGTEGDGTGDKGYWYVSYEDASLTEMVAVDAVPLEKQYDNNYQHDGTALPLALKFPSGIKYASVFKAKASSSYSEELKAVSVCTFTSNVSYEVQVYTGLTSVSKPTSGTKAVSGVKGTLTNAGYQTIELPKAVALVPGEYFSVVVTLKTASGELCIGIDSTWDDGWITFSSKVEKNQSFVYEQEKWYNILSIEDKYDRVEYANLRIKAYTDTTKTKPSIKLSSSSLGVSKGSSATLSLRKNPVNIYRKVTWKSSNKKIATVSSSGKVKGKSYGNTTIQATFMKGNKKTTLKCKVTVGPSKLKSYKVSAGKGKVTVRWKKNSAANGYEIYYSKKEDSGFKKLTTAKASKTKVTKKLKSGTYYVKMRAYKLQGKKKLYGSYTVTKKVTVR